MPIILFDYIRKKEREGPGTLLCPYIDDPSYRTQHFHNGKRKPQKFKVIERLGPYLIRYKCVYCKNTFKVDRTPIFRYGMGLDKSKLKYYKPNF